MQTISKTKYMQDHSKCKQIRILILKFWEAPITDFNTSQILNFVKTQMNTEYIMPDTILRIMRYLKADGLINYECLNRRQMHYRKVFPIK